MALLWMMRWSFDKQPFFTFWEAEGGVAWYFGLMDLRELEPTAMLLD